MTSTAEIASGFRAANSAKVMGAGFSNTLSALSSVCPPTLPWAGVFVCCAEVADSVNKTKTRRVDRIGFMFGTVSSEVS